MNPIPFTNSPYTTQAQSQPPMLPTLATPLIEVDFHRNKPQQYRVVSPNGTPNTFASTPNSLVSSPYIHTPSSVISTPTTSTSKRKGCTCKKSGCLKRYCECFAKRDICTSDCKCVDCCNNDHPESKAKREAGIHNVLVRNPLAFQQTDQRRHGCKCRRSGCVKKYCECYRASKTCTELCECIYFQICQNNPGGGCGDGFSVFSNNNLVLGNMPSPITPAPAPVPSPQPTTAQPIIYKEHSMKKARVKKDKASASAAQLAKRE